MDITHLLVLVTETQIPGILNCAFPIQATKLINKQINKYHKQISNLVAGPKFSTPIILKPATGDGPKQKWITPLH